MIAETYAGGRLIARADDSARTVTTWDEDGTPRVLDYNADERADADARAAARTRQVNGGTLRDRARTALDANRAFLALASPTNAQTLAQVRALTRQAQGLIRLDLDDLNSTD